MQEMEELNMSQATVIIARHTSITQMKNDKFMFNYGSVDARYLPVLKSSKLALLNGIDNLAGVGVTPYDDDYVIPLGSNYGQAIIATLYALSISGKLKLIKKDSSVLQSPYYVMFSFSTFSIGIEELAMIALAKEIADELFCLSTLRMEVVYADTKKNVSDYVECGRIVLRGLRLIEVEIKKRHSAGLKNSSQDEPAVF